MRTSHLLIITHGDKLFSLLTFTHNSSAHTQLSGICRKLSRPLDGGQELQSLTSAQVLQLNCFDGDRPLPLGFSLLINYSSEKNV